MVKTENGIETYIKEQFNAQARFWQRLVASSFDIQPEKRIRNKEMENKVNRCRKKTLGYEGDTQDDYYWSDDRDLFEEIIAKITTARIGLLK